MAGFKDLANVWRNVREVDLRPIRDQALQEVKIALVGEPGSGRHTLAEQLRRDPSRPQTRTHTPVILLDLASANQASEADLILLVVRADQTHVEPHQSLAHLWSSAGKKVIVFLNQFETDAVAAELLEGETIWDAQRVFMGSVRDTGFLVKEFVPAVMELLPDHHLSLARHFPLFRLPVAHALINETCFANATYALSTGLAENVPALNIPLNVTDMVVLTKAQVFLVYRLGLALGFSTRWQDYVAEFGSVIGGGFLWRQLARQLVGLIPVWGVIPKVAVAYSGTFVVGHVVLRWYLTGRHLSPKQLAELYRQSFRQGLGIARALLAKAPRPRLGKRKRHVELPPTTTSPQTLELPMAEQVCPSCGKTSAADAHFCQYCGQALMPLSPPEVPQPS